MAAGTRVVGGHGRRPPQGSRCLQGPGRAPDADNGKLAGERSKQAAGVAPQLGSLT